MPDVSRHTDLILLMGNPGEYPYTYRLGGNTCLSGDIIGTIHLSLKPGDVSS